MIEQEIDSETGIISVNRLINVISLTPNPAGAPGITNPITHDIEIMLTKLRNEK